MGFSWSVHFHPSASIHPECNYRSIERHRIAWCIRMMEFQVYHQVLSIWYQWFAICHSLVQRPPSLCSSPFCTGPVDFCAFELWTWWYQTRTSAQSQPHSNSNCNKTTGSPKIFGTHNMDLILLGIAELRHFSAEWRSDLDRRRAAASVAYAHPIPWADADMWPEHLRQVPSI